MRELFTIAIFKIKADIRMNKTALNSQKEKHFMLSLRRATPALLPITVSISQFLSTISLRRATVPWPTVSPPTPNFYPRSPCGERRAKIVKPSPRSIISIHALLAESDGSRQALHIIYPRTFLSTLSLRRATIVLIRSGFGATNFYPRSPCGERQVVVNKSHKPHGFLSTLSLRRAT